MTHNGCHWILIFINWKPTHYILMAGNGCSQGTWSQVYTHLYIHYCPACTALSCTLEICPISNLQLTKLQCHPQDPITLFLVQHLSILWVLFCRYMTALRALRYLAFFQAFDSGKWYYGRTSIFIGKRGHFLIFMFIK